MDKRAQMGGLGNVDQYMKFQAADVLGDAAQNEGGGVGLGAGFAVGNQMAGAFGAGLQASTSGGPAGASPATIACPTCGKANASGVKFCADCGGKMEIAQVPCVKCNANLREGAKFCPECGTKTEGE